MKSGDGDFRLKDIIDNERIRTYFQPIVSLKTGEIFAYEALVRGIRQDSSDLIEPHDLFARAELETVSGEFDNLCRKKALEEFGGVRLPSGAMVFVNIDTSIITAASQTRPHINSVARQMGFKPESIGLELIESEAYSADELVGFVNRYRDSGFLIVIDDFGCGQSNIDRLIQIQPDIIKIDRSIISGIESDAYRQSILKSIHSLAEMTGSLCLAEGVETLPEITTCHLLGVDLFQGFAIARPAPDLAKLETDTLARIAGLQADIRKVSLESLKRTRRLTGDINMLADWFIRQLPGGDIDGHKSAFEDFIAMNGEIECIYLLDAAGTQISDTIAGPLILSRNRPGIFSPALRGANHSFKPYYTCFEALGVKRYLTDVYLSLASGNLCRTFSVKLDFTNACGNILCIDFLEEAIRNERTSTID